MKKLTKLFSIIVLAAVVGFITAGCGGAGGGDNGGGDDPIVISGTLSGGSTPASSVLTPMMSSRSISDSQLFYSEIQDDNSIAGKLQDLDMIFNLRGRFDPATKVFTMQAASSIMVFSIAGKLDANNAVIQSSAEATVQVNDNGEWKTINLTPSFSNQTVSGDVTVTGGAETPAWGRGTWYDQLTGMCFIVTENSITMVDDNGDSEQMSIVEIEPSGPNAIKLLIRAKIMGSGISSGVNYTARLYVANSFDATLNSAIGNLNIKAALGYGPDDATFSQAVGMLGDGDKMFVSPYCSNDSNKVITEDEFKSVDNYYPMFKGNSATANAKAATDIKAISTFTLALMQSIPSY